jgi:hypothetical protein
MTSNADPTDAVESLRSASIRLIDSFMTAPADAWGWSPPSGGWSISEVAEHVAISSGNILAGLEHRLQPIGAASVTDDEIPYLFYRGDEPPDVGKPTGSWIDRVDAAAELSSRTKALMEWATASTLDLRTHGFAHPLFGRLDGVQWILFTGAHAMRHRSQIIGLVLQHERA